MATPNSFGIREVALATFYDLTTGKALVQLDNLKTSGLENKGEVIYARGGRGNPKIMGFNSNREGTVKLQDALFTTQVLAMMVGNGLATASQDVYQRDVLVVAANAVTLHKTPSTAGTLISVYVLNDDNSHGAEKLYAASTAATKYTVTGKTVAFFASELTAGTRVVAYYKAQTDVTAKKVIVTSDKFSGTYKVVLDCLVRDALTQNDYAAQIVIYNAKMENSWNFSMASTGEPSVFDINLEILKPVGSTVMWEMVVYDNDLVL